MSILTRDSVLVRHAVPDLSKVSMGVDASKVAAQCRALSGEGDLDDVKAAMINRYAQVIVSMKDDKTGVTDSNIYRANSQLRLDHAASQAIIHGQQEITRLYLFNSIVRQRATLFTEASARYEYEGATTGETISEVREEAGANIAAQRWDVYADGIGSCAMYISDAGGTLQYSEIPAHKIWIAFAESISDNGQDRPTNTSAIDEASVVCVELAPDGDKRRFSTWIGPCDAYEQGRQVVYTANDWHDIPDVGNQGAQDYSVGARAFVRGATDPGNPLSLIASSQGARGPVYPIVILYGDSQQSGILPTSCSLYDVAAELDLMGSMVLGAAGRGARGAQALKRGMDTAIPDNVSEGLVLLGREQELLNVGWPASHSKDAMDVLSAHCRWIAEAHNVPGFLVANDQSGEVPSGVALEMMMLPLTRNRASRIALNKSSVARRFAIERAVINGAVGKAAIPWEEKETWHAGERVWPRDPEQTLRVWEKRIQMKEATLADLTREMRGINTDEEAWNLIAEKRKQEEEHADLISKPEPPPVAPVKLSLAQRLQARKPVEEEPEEKRA